MPKLRLAVVLPIVQFPIALAIVIWNYVLLERRPAFIIFYRPAATSLCHAMDAPALMVGGLIAEGIRFLMSSVVPLRPNWSSPSIYRIPLGEVLFLASVVVLWFLVGRVLDRRSLAGVPTRRARAGGPLSIRSWCSWEPP
jgi:hypothetical protein